MKDETLARLGKLSRILKRMPGSVLLLEYVRRKFSHTDRKMTINDFDCSLTISLHLAEHMQSQIFWYGYYSRDIIMVMDNILSQGMVVFDIGANIGEISLCAAKRVGAEGKVYCFEPMPTLYEKLTHNLSVNAMMHAFPIRLGVSKNTGVVPIYRADSNFSDGTIHEGLGTLYPMDNRTTPVGEIQLVTLDAFCEEEHVQRLDLIKIDVEGAELDVLMGAEHVIRKYRPYLIIEIQSETAQASGVSPEEILDYLQLLEYSIFTIGRKGKLSPLSREMLRNFQNVLCVPK